MVAKTRRSEAEPEDCGGTTLEGENKVLTSLRSNPKGRGRFLPFRCRLSLQWLSTVRSFLLELGRTGSCRRYPSSVTALTHLDRVWNRFGYCYRQREPEGCAVPQAALDGDLAAE